jgi:hypothetical protein
VRALFTPEQQAGVWLRLELKSWLGQRMRE